MAERFGRTFFLQSCWHSIFTHKKRPKTKNQIIVPFLHTRAKNTVKSGRGASFRLSRNDNENRQSSIYQKRHKRGGIFMNRNIYYTLFGINTILFLLFVTARFLSPHNICSNPDFDRFIVFEATCLLHKYQIFLLLGGVVYGFFTLFFEYSYDKSSNNPVVSQIYVTIMAQLAMCWSYLTFV